MPSPRATHTLVLLAALTGCTQFPARPGVDQGPNDVGAGDTNGPTDLSDGRDTPFDTVPNGHDDTNGDDGPSGDVPVDGVDALPDPTDLTADTTIDPDLPDTMGPADAARPDACARQCVDRTCGDDGCGGLCGTCGQGFGCLDGSCESRPWTLFLRQAEGFGAGVTGGADGQLCEVTSGADTGPNTLRACLANGGPVWVRFGASVNVALTSRLDIPSDTTIDGRGHRVAIQGEVLRLVGVENVVLHNLILDGAGRSAGHGVHLSDGASRVWLHHISFFNQPDTGVRIADTSTDVTVSRCWFGGIVRGLNVGSDGTSTNARVTVHHNLFRNVDRYAPRMRGGRLHAYNNLIENWDIIGAAITDDGQLLSEANLYSEDDLVPAVTVDIDGDNAWGFVRSEGDVVYGRTFVQQHRPERVLAVPYAYQLAAPDDDLIIDLNVNVGYREMEFPGE